MITRCGTCLDVGSVELAVLPPGAPPLYGSKSRLIWGVAAAAQEQISVRLSFVEVEADDPMATERGVECPACKARKPFAWEGRTVVRRRPPIAGAEEPHAAGSTSSASSKPRARSAHAGHVAQPGRSP